MRSICATTLAVAMTMSAAIGGPLDELLPRPKSVVPMDGVATSGVPVVVELKAIECVNPLTADEAYRLTISTNEITITAAGLKGERAARATLGQLKKLSDGRLPCCEIADAPAFRWRGFMHDCGRNFLDKAEILKLLDLMAAYKFNLFHWHITDYYGWRLESRKYPMLQAPWAFRRQMNRYYTQEDFKEVVAYAKARGITVMPELDVPGHTLAFRRGLGITHMSEPQVKEIVADLLDELCSLVPAEDMPFVHLGTDEARTPYEMVPDSYCPHWAEMIRGNGRIPVAWTPGKPFVLPDGSRPARMVWQDGYKAEKDELIFDTVRGYFGSKDPLTFLNTAVFSKPMRYDIPAENMLGAIICSWHDDSLGEDTARIWTNCSFAPAIVAYSDYLWNGREKDRPEYLVKLPAPGTPAFAEVVAFEDAIVANRDKVIRPLGLPFAYVRQTPLRFRITDSKGVVVANDIAQATVTISDCGRHTLDRANSYLMETQGVAYVETWIKSPRDQIVGAWIGFTMFGRSGGRRHGLPEEGEWGRSPGTKVEVNGNIVPAPAWIHPGLKHIMTHPEEPTSDNIAETPFTNEEYFMRPPTEISLKAGWNHVKLTVPKSVGDEWGYSWVSTFVPVTLERHPREVPGLEFSSEPKPGSAPEPPPVRLAYNYCTLSYTFAYYGEKEWEQEIDRIAKAGYNAALVIDGTFKVWQATLRELGYGEKAIAEFIPDECARAWWLMDNLFGEGGPLDQATIDEDARRGRFICEKMRERGIEPILQGFFGMMPLNHPGSVPQGGWGIAYERPPMLDPTGDEYLNAAKAWYRNLETVYGIKPKYLAGDLFHEGGNPGDIDVTAATRAVQSAQQAAFPGVTWVVQAWQRNPTPEVRAGLDPRHTLVEALAYDVSSLAKDDAVCDCDYGELPWVWCAVLNFGGNHGLYGNLKTLAHMGRAAKGKGAKVFRGYGSLSEGFFTNPVCDDLFEYMMMQPAGTELTDAGLVAWLDNWVDKRYGLDPNSQLTTPNTLLHQAWRILAETAYACPNCQEGAVENVICAKPAWDANNARTYGPKCGLYYDAAKLEKALALMEVGAKGATLTEAFKRDLYDLRRQVMANKLRALMPRLKNDAAARQEFIAIAESMCGVGDDVPNEFRLFWWEGMARRRAGERGVKAWRRMITTWNDAKYGTTRLENYANREYPELIRDHYLPRWKKFFAENAEE